MLSTNIRKLRKEAGLSQERMAEELCVSRQAVTKWETDGGTPDLDNLQAIAQLFGVSVDSLLGGDSEEQLQSRTLLYTSVTQCDAEAQRDFDIDFGYARNVTLRGIPGEKVRVTLLSGEISDIESLFKVRLDTGGKSIDINVIHTEEATSAQARDALDVLIELPAIWENHVELAGNATCLAVEGLHAKRIELSGKFSHLHVDGCAETVDVDTNLDLAITCTALPARLNVNQVSATSKLMLPEGAAFSTRKRGIGNRIVFEGTKDTEGASSQVELNGVKSELTITMLV